MSFLMRCTSPHLGSAVHTFSDEKVSGRKTGYDRQLFGKNLHSRYTSTRLFYGGKREHVLKKIDELKGQIRKKSEIKISLQYVHIVTQSTILI